MFCAAISGCNSGNDAADIKTIESRLAYLDQIPAITLWKVTKPNSIVIAFDDRPLPADAPTIAKSAAANVGSAMKRRTYVWLVPTRSGATDPPNESYCYITADQTGVVETDGSVCN